MNDMTPEIVADTIAGQISDAVLDVFIRIARRAQGCARLDEAEAALLIQLALPVGLEAQRARGAGAVSILPETAPADLDLRLRRMTDGEARGFAHACDMMMLWAAQLERQAHRIPEDDSVRVSTRDTIATRARFCRNMAEALLRAPTL